MFLFGLHVDEVALQLSTPRVTLVHLQFIRTVTLLDYLAAQFLAEIAASSFIFVTLLRCCCFVARFAGLCLILQSQLLYLLRPQSEQKGS